MVAHQVHEYLEQHRLCPECGKRHTSKDSGGTPVKTVFGQVDVPNPRWNRCACQTQGPKTFRPTKAWLDGRTSPEMLYVETKWASPGETKRVSIPLGRRSFAYWDVHNHDWKVGFR